MAHRYHFFRAGAVDQVSLRNGDDLLAIPDLDQKLWVALAMPTQGTDLDPTTLALLDPDKDGRVRVPDIKAAITWVKATFKTPADVLKSADQVALTAIADAKVLAAAKRVLADLGKKDATAISVADAGAVQEAFTKTVLNGDGIIIADSTDDADLKKAIEDTSAAHGTVTDRSGKPGIDQAKLDAFFADVDAAAAWSKQASADAAVLPLGDATAAAAEAMNAVAAKLDDYFARCRLAAFDGRAVATLSGQDADFQAMAGKSLTTGADDIAKLPLARIEATGRLALSAGLNPAWAGPMAAFVAKAVVPVLGAREVLTADDLGKVQDKLAAYQAWHKAKPATHAAGLDAAWLAKLAGPDVRAKLADLVRADAALADDYAEIASVDRLVRYQRDLGRILRNFVNFSDFYSRKDGVFQAGTLYLDGRAAHLCVPVTDAGKHGALAGSSAAYLVYCDITRGGDKKQIAAAITNGDADNLFVGRNGIFYDRKGQDWDATITKVVANPISIREAFWAPYKKVIRLIEDQVGKRAAAADAAADAKLQSAATAAANADKAATKDAAAVGAKPPEPKKIDVGTVAAIGVAIGGIGALVVGVLGTFLGLGKWLPIGVLALLLMISGPSMLLAWLKLRQRNLGPILDANGWAINGRARINVSFGAAMTELAKLPAGAQRSFDDPYADKQRPWKLYIFLIVLLVLAGTWYVGKLDKWLPEGARSVSVLGKSAPAYKAAAEPAAPAAAPAAPAAP
jgi:hypothetical protein